MRMKAIFTALLAATSAPILAADPPKVDWAEPVVKADTIFVNGQIYTRDGWAEAMAVAKGTLIAVGTNAEVQAAAGPSAKVIDLSGKAVLPGFHDMHIHTVSGGRTFLQCMIERGASPERIKEIVSGCAARIKPGEWITGRGWANAVFKGKVQDKSLLDEAAPDNPVILNDETGHSTWVNSLALKMAGIDRKTPNPLNGIIEHDAKGEPLGVMREAASGLIMRLVPPLDDAGKDKAMDRALEAILSNGITSIQDAGGYDSSTYDSIAVYARAFDRGAKMPRSKLCTRWTYNVTGVDPVFEKIYSMRGVFRRDKVLPDCVKFGADGVPGDGHTAAMLEPYAGTTEADSQAFRYGFMNVPPAVLAKMVTRFDAAGLSALIHCTGDACARAAVDAVEAARKANGNSGILHQVGHSNFTTKVDLARGRDLGVSFEYSAYLYYLNAATETYRKAIGAERFLRYKPLRDTIDVGALTLEGSDWPVSASTNPFIAIETLVTRERPGGGGEPLAPAQRITLAEAVDVYTINAAKQFGHAASVGMLKPGYAADFIVLDRNPFKIPITDVHAIKVLQTWVGGDLSFTAGSKSL